VAEPERASTADGQKPTSGPTAGPSQARSTPDSSAQDARDAAALFDLLEQDVLPAFYDRDADGLPRAWLARIRASMRTLAPALGAGRDARRLCLGGSTR
jgi:glycogen phosphorylase